jgi:hypothetical protein
MADFASRVKKAVGEGLKAVKKGAEIVVEKTPKVAATVAEKTQEAVAAGKLNIQIQGLERDVERNFGSLGKRVYALVGKKAQRIEQDESVQRGVKAVDSLKKRIKALEKKKKALGT